MYLYRIPQAGMESLLKICWSIESKQKAEIADSMSLLISCSAIFDFYLAKAKHRGKRSFSRWLGRSWRHEVSLLTDMSFLKWRYTAKANCQLLVERVLFFEGKKVFYKKLNSRVSSFRVHLWI